MTTGRAGSGEIGVTMNAIHLVGSDFHLVSPSRLEQLSRNREAIHARILALQQHGQIRGAVQLATCNRFELLIELEPDRSLGSVREILGVDSGFPLHEYEGEPACEHLLGVAAGLHSLAFGEEQILGQVRTAFRTAEEFGLLSRRLHMLFTRLLRAARDVRHRVGLDHRPRSVAALAVDQVAGAGSRIAVVGIGEMGRLVVEIMQRRHLPAPLIVNRTLTRAEALAEHVGGRAMSLRDFLDRRPELDGVVFAIGSDEPLWGKAEVEGLRVVVDISQPSVLRPDARQAEGSEVYDLDDFAQRAEEEQRRYASVRATGMVEVRALARQLWRDVAAGRPNLGRVVDMHVEGAIAEFENAITGRLRHLAESDRACVRDLLVRTAKRNAHHHIRDLRQLVAER